MRCQVGFTLKVRAGIAQGGLRLRQLRTRTGDLRIALLQLGLIRGRVDFGKDVALLHWRIEVHQHIGHLPGNLATHRHRGNGTERTGGGNRHPNITALHGLCAVTAGSIGSFMFTPVIAARCQRCDYGRSHGNLAQRGKTPGT